MYNIIPSLVDQTCESFLQNFRTLLLSKSLLDYTGDTQVSNFERIKRRYTVSELKTNQSNYDSGRYQDIVIKHGTNILVPDDQIMREVIGTTDLPDVFQTSEYTAFLATQLQSLLQDPDYSNVISNKDASIQLINNEFTVFMWIRCCSDDGVTQGSWVNVTSYVESVTTNITQQGGSFTLTFLPVQSEFDPKFGWRPAVISDNFNDTVIVQSVINRYVESSDQSKSGYKRSGFFFHDCILENDLVYIRFEQLSNERKSDIVNNKSLSFTDIPGLIYDLIGLVDRTLISTSADNNVRIEVSGRDLIKPFIEDSSFFSAEYLAQQTTNTGVSFFNNDGILARRNRIELVLQSSFFAIYAFKPLDLVLKFIFNKFSNLGCVSDDAFVGYGDRQRSKKYTLLESSTDPALQLITQADNVFLSEEVRGVWRIMNLVFDPQIKKRLLADSSLSPESGSILNSINKFCQQPFVEFYTDTYGDQFYLIIRKPPFDRSSIETMLYGQVAQQDDVEVVDKQSSNTLNDTSKGFVFEEQNTDLDLDQVTITSKREGFVLDIEEEQVVRENLTYHTEAYSWYTLYPQGLLPDLKKASLIIPVVSFDEYAEIWGSRQFNVVNNYIPIELYNQDKVFDSSNTYVLNQIFNDLKFVVESNAYLPFARKGTITLVGDRRIKRGTYVRYKPTGEIFYVDSTSNSRTFSKRANLRSTTLSVTRGLVEDYIKGVDVKFNDGTEQSVSYFNLISMEIPARAQDTSFLKDWRVNRNVFDFFINKRQWII